MNNLISNDVKMTSLDIAEVTKKQHKHVLADVRNGLKHGYLDEKDFRKSEYINVQNKRQPCMSITEKGFTTLMSLYETRKRRSSPDTIYIIKHIGMSGYYKIGVTSNLDGRLNILNNASPLGVRLIYKKEVNEAMKLETHIHNLLSDKNTNLEWFKLSSDNLRKVIGLIERGHIHEFAS